MPEPIRFEPIDFQPASDTIDFEPIDFQPVEEKKNKFKIDFSPIKEAVKPSIDSLSKLFDPYGFIPKTQEASADIQKDPLRLAKGVARGVGGMVEGVGGTSKMVGLDKQGQQIADYGRKMTEFYAVEDPKFIDQLAEGGGSMATFFIPGLGISKVAKALSFAPVLAEYFGIAASSLIESGVEAGNNYENALKQGKDAKEAQQVGEATFFGNLPVLLLTNKFGGLFEESGGSLAKALKSGFFEGTQEGTQQVIGNVASGRPTMEGVGESALIGSILGSGVKGMTGALTSLQSKIDKTSQIKAQKESEKLRETQIKDIVAKNGGEFIGIQKGMPADEQNEALPDMVMFNEPTGSTLAIPAQDFSPDAVKKKLAEFNENKQQEEEKTALIQKRLENLKKRPIGTFKKDISAIKDILSNNVRGVNQGYAGFENGIGTTSENLLNIIDKIGKSEPITENQERTIRNAIESKREYDLRGAVEARAEQTKERTERDKFFGEVEKIAGKPQIEGIKTPHEIIAKEMQPDGTTIPIYKPTEAVKAEPLNNEMLANSGVNDKNYESYLHKLPSEITEAEYVTAKQLQYYHEKGDIVPLQTAREWYQSFREQGDEGVRKSIEQFKIQKQNIPENKGVSFVTKAPIQPETAIGAPKEKITPKITETQKEDFQKRVIAGQDLAKTAKEQKYIIPINSDGSITIYHGTNAGNALKINNSGKIERQSFFSPNKQGAEYYGKAKNKSGEILSMKVDARDIEYSTGTGEIYAPEGLAKDTDGIWKNPERINNPTPKAVTPTEGGKIKAYHGTNEDFDAFDLSKAKSSSGSQSAGGGIWFTDDKRVAAEFADWSSFGGNKGKPIIKEAVLNLKNPKVYDSKDGWDAFQQYKFDLEKFKTKKSSHIQAMRSMTEPDTELSSEGQFIGKKLGEISLNMVDDEFDYQGFRDSLIKQGYDGIILKNSLTDAVGDKNPEPHTQYLVFDPKQIKLSPTEGKVFTEAQKPLAKTSKEGEGKIDITAKDLVESKTTEEIQEKLQQIFGKYDVLDRISDGELPATPEFEAANKYMADIEYAAKTKDINETEELLKRAKEEIQTARGKDILRAEKDAKRNISANTAKNKIQSLKTPQDFQSVTAKEAEILKKVNPDKAKLQDFLLNQDGSAKLRKVITRGMERGETDEAIARAVEKVLPRGSVQEQVKQSEFELSEKLPKKKLPAGLSIEDVSATPKIKDEIILPEGISIEFKNKELESRWKNAKGIKGISIWEKAKTFAEHIKNIMTRTYSDIPKDAKHAQFLELIDKQKNGRTIAKENSLRMIQSITADLGKKQFGLFTRKVILDDLIFDMEQGKALPLGFTPETLKEEKARIDAIVEKNPIIKESIKKRKGVQDAIVSDLLKNEIITTEQAQNPNYFHHQVLDYVNAKNYFGISQKFKKVKPGFAKKRMGTELDINTDYLESEFDYMTQALQAINTIENLDKLEKSKYNIKEELKKTHGKEWKANIPKDYAIWQAKEGNIFYRQKSIPETAFARLVEGIIPEELARDALFVGGKRPEMVLPANIVKTLNELNAPLPRNDTEAAFDMVTKIPIKLWKQWVLFNPIRVLKYNYQNMLGDLDAAISANPGSLKYFGRSFTELLDHFYGNKPMTSEMKDFFERGGLTAGITINELPELKESSVFARLYDKANPLQKANIVKKWFRMAGKASTFRENLLRYALYLDYSDRFYRDKPGSAWVLKYGASDPKVIDALPSYKDKAAKVATEVLGDYGNISEFGQIMRDRVSPFFSWLEINFKRYPKFLANAVKQGTEKETIGRAALGGTLKLGGTLTVWGLRAGALWAAVQLWNNLKDPEAERELNEYDRRRMHIFVGRRKNGDPIILRGQGALGDFFEWFGINELPGLAKLLADGKIDVPYMLKEMAKMPANKAFGSISPLYKATAELVAGQSFFPDVFEPRAVRDRGRQILQNVQLEDIYDRVMGKPSRPLGKLLLKATPIVSKSVDENAYNDIQNLKRLFLKQEGKGSFSNAYFTPRSQAVYYYKQAIRFEDEKAKKKYLEEIKKLNITGKEFNRILKTLDPLSGLTKKEKSLFVGKFLNYEDRQRLNKAMNHYKGLIGNALPEEEPEE